MMNDPRVELDCKNRKFILRGECLAVLEICKGMCCRHWRVFVTQTEFESGQYKTKTQCSADGSDCAGRTMRCLNRLYFLESKEDGSCLYQNEDGTCPIYDRRPAVCRNFSCQNGWMLSSVFPTPPKVKGRAFGSPLARGLYPRASTAEVDPRAKPGAPVADEVPNQETRNIPPVPREENPVFLLNPLVTLKTVFMARDKKQINLVTKWITKCTYTSISEYWENHDMTEEYLLFFARLFDGKNTMKDVCVIMNDTSHSELTFDEAWRLVIMLNRHGIIVYKNQG